MDARSTFLDWCACDVVTDPDRGSPLLDWGPRETSWPAGKSAAQRRGRERERNLRGVAKAPTPGPEKNR